MRFKDKFIPNWEWRIPITFYGKVVDETGVLIEGASIFFSWSDLSDKGASTANTVSDGEGLFSLTGKKGKGLLVDVKKSGYYQRHEDRLRGFEYADFSAADYYQSDRDHPVIFHLLKQGQIDPLLTGHIRTKIPTDGTPVRFDLLQKGRRSDDGQFEISAVTNTEDYPPRTYDWSTTFFIRNGGLQEFTDIEFPFTAPTEGYQTSRVQIDMPKSAPHWIRGIDKTYFIQFGNPPKYGRIHLRVSGASEFIELDFWVNPSGSINLEWVEENNSPGN